MSARAGVTLIELLVVIAILGITAAVVALRFPVRGRANPTGIDDARARARNEAIARGAPVTMVFSCSTTPRLVTALPDGRLFDSQNQGDSCVFHDARTP